MLFRYFSTLRTYTSAKSATGRFFSTVLTASCKSHPCAHITASAIIGARCTPAAQWMYNAYEGVGVLRLALDIRLVLRSG